MGFRTHYLRADADIGDANADGEYLGPCDDG